ncbi:MAG: diacylglycerol kinase family protein [Patescibacteria group bacterium]
MSDKYSIIFNPTANRGKAASALPKIEKFFNEHKLGYEILLTRRPDEATALAEELSKGGNIIIAAGGDGTIHEVVNGMKLRRNVLGLLPLGSGNDFANALGYSHRLSANLNIIEDNNIRDIDLGQIDGKVFINSLAIGFDAVVADKFNRSKKFLPGKAAYLRAIFSAIWQLRSYPIKIQTAELTDDKEVVMTAITNGHTYGGGLPINPTAKINDGLLNICVIEKLNRRYLTRNLPKLIKGKHGQLPEVTMFTSKKISLESDQGLPLALDGEIIEPQKKLTVNIIPKAIKIITK